MKKRVHIFVSGLVQGVNFRYYTREMAKKLGVLGWVKNLRDGRVEVMMEGEEEKVQKMIDWLKKGPPLARVENLEIEFQDFQNEFSDFDIKYS